ncbi:F0F1 ATP synthase subunit B [Liquorilactobacillus satsumensis]|uniref:ATP synthase subunit b n=1 Tax=Liquorilactobacillus satsumensis DSM 16230 = JCM 12392 TaxID=1423801 RepID=A0A0R1UVX9_9LACO|nr:F0F1 ATP synthase subunit B [Liquorilactobacillus satsumensis]KRL97376.1 ATP synthase B chain [Liquorilactobacillus satsumensis DSM 16230 = JCM 12392]MCC7667313.1 ATP synthase F0 subunit B [Liquorilactobacillus satsumensis]MCP9327639.1 F0F1 ATP synthase subunit B [Liquorilactobacillus satsumensis]MCP9357089.1 F0F1 ATP synthase subunit B [Liquorilactobacillus satsumensis]MCP9371036.1 F0F1 ATP synthase subunit B [Liquorilactobacillus satsumensis]
MGLTFVLGAATGVEWGDMLFYAVLFVVLLALIKHYAWGPVTDMMEKRATKIANDLDSAEEARKNAEQVEEQRVSALKDSHAEASQIIERARKNGEQQKTTIVADAHGEAQALKDTAKQDIERERQDALEGVKNDVAELSLEIASKVISKNLQMNDQKALIDSYIEGLGKQNEVK